MGPKRGYSGPIPKFPCPNFLGNSFCFKYRLEGGPERRSGMPGSSSTVLAHMEPPSSRKQAKRVRLGPKRTLFACFLELGGSIWAKTVLDEPGIPLRRSGPPSSLYLKQKEFPKKLGHGNLGIGPE